MDFSKFDYIQKLLITAREHLDEQYDNENIRLNDIIIDLSTMVKEKEEKIQELQKKIDENTFDEQNYNKVSILRTLTKENDELKKENQKLMTSLNYRNVEPEPEQEQEQEPEPEEVSNIITYKDKQYIQEGDIIYRIKKNGDKGKQAGNIINEKIKFINKKSTN